MPTISHVPHIYLLIAIQRALVFYYTCLSFETDREARSIWLESIKGSLIALGDAHPADADAIVRAVKNARCQLAAIKKEERYIINV